MKNIFVTILLIAVLSCNRDEDSLTHQTEMLKGNYVMVSLTSDTSIDLNGDGISTDNFKNELSEFYSSYYHPVLKIRDLAGSDEKKYFEVVIPRAVIHPEYNDYIPVYLSADHTAQITYYNSNNKLIYEIGNSEDYQLSHGLPIIKNIEVLPDKKIKVTVKQKYYHHPDGWYDCILTGIYEKE